MSDLEHEGEVPAFNKRSNDITARANEKRKDAADDNEQGGGGPYSETCWPRDTEPTNAGRMRKNE